VTTTEIMRLVDDVAEHNRELGGFKVLGKYKEDTSIYVEARTRKAGEARAAVEARIEALVGERDAALAVVETAGKLFDFLPSTGTPYDDLADQLARDLDAVAALVAAPADGEAGP